MGIGYALDESFMPQGSEHSVSPFTRLRIQRALTQQEIAEKLHIKRQSLSKWETGETQPALRHRRMLADLLGISVEKLVDIFPPKPRRAATGVIQTDTAPSHASR